MDPSSGSVKVEIKVPFSKTKVSLTPSELESIKTDPSKVVVVALLKTRTLSA